MANETKQKAPRRYEKMRNSGVEWIGMVPEEWHILPAKKMFSEVKEKNRKNEYNNPFSFRYGEIVGKKLPGKTDTQLAETLSAYQVVMPNDIVLNGLNLNYDFVTQRVAIVQNKGIITSAYLVVHPDSNKIGPRYAMYLLKSFDYRQVFHGIGSGIRKTLKFQDFKELPILCPSEATQNAIAKYLDEKSKFIDEVIAEAKASIEEYKAWKSSIIYEAVTKGLDPTTEMKDSGVEWIGKIPAHWGISRIRKTAEFYNGDRTSRYPKPDDFVSTGISFINSTNLNSDTLDISTCKFITEEKYNSLSGAKLQPNDIVFCLRGSVGKCSINLMLQKGTVASSLMTIRPQKMSAQFLLYVLLSDVTAQQTAIYMNGTCAANLSAENVGNYLIPIPPTIEQEKIANYLVHKSQIIDALIKEKQTLISDLESYKQSFIYEVVTGKRKVV